MREKTMGGGRKRGAGEKGEKATKLLGTEKRVEEQKRAKRR